MMTSVATCVLLAVWPILNFLAHNKRERLEFQPIAAAALLSILGALLIGFLLRLVLGRRVQLRATLPAAGLAVAGFLSYDVVGHISLRLQLSGSATLVIWFVLWVATLGMAVWAFRRPPVLQAAALAAIVATAIPAAEFTYYSVTHQASSSNGAVRPLAPVAKEASASLPNVYFFILDMYSRGDNLKRYYGYDNSAFLNLLEQRGFRIASKSHSNYRATRESLTTTLYMDYVLPVLRDGVKVSRDPSSAVPLLRENPNLFETAAGPFADLTRWHPYGNNRVEREGTGLRVTSVRGQDSEKGLYRFLNGSEGLTADLVVGNRYRLAVTARASSGAAVRVILHNGSAYTKVQRGTGALSNTHTLDFSAAAPTMLFFDSMQVGTSIRIDRVELRRLDSPMSQTLADVKFDFRMDDHLVNAYLGSFQHLSPVLTTFRNLNYQVLFANQHGSRTDGCDPYCIGGQRHLTFQTIAMLGMTPFVDMLNLVKPDAWRNLTTLYQKNPLEVVNQIPENVPTPFFLFAHILSPHPPFIYASDCSIRDEYRFELDPTMVPVGELREWHKKYLEQLTCVNTLMMDAVDKILLKDPGAVVVIQGDHGFGKLETLEAEGLTGAAKYTEEDFQGARYGILNAFRVPKPCDGYLYDSMSSVNTFRLVFACLADSAPNFVPDRFFGEPQGDAAPEIQLPAW